MFEEIRSSIGEFLAMMWLLFLVTVAFPGSLVSAQVFISSPKSGRTVCYNEQFEVTCWYPYVTEPGRYLTTVSPTWTVNGQPLTLDGSTYSESRINETAYKLIFTGGSSVTVGGNVTYTCYLVLLNGELDESAQQVEVNLIVNPNPPVITDVNSSNNSISANWTHDRNCFDNDPVKYHVLLVNTGDRTNRTIKTGQLKTDIEDVTPGTDYIVSIRAVNETRRSEPDNVTLTAGYPQIRSYAPACSTGNVTLYCILPEGVAGQAKWFKDGRKLNNDEEHFVINNSARSLTVPDLPKYADRNMSFQCCVQQSHGPGICGQSYQFIPQKKPAKPEVNFIPTDTSIHLSLDSHKECNFTFEISWKSPDGKWRSVNTTEHCYCYSIPDLQQNTQYNITVVAIGDGVRSEVVVIPAKTSISRAWVAVPVVIVIVVVLVLMGIIAAVCIYIYRKKGRKNECRKKLHDDEKSQPQETAPERPEPEGKVNHLQTPENKETASKPEETEMKDFEPLSQQAPREPMAGPTVQQQGQEIYVMEPSEGNLDLCPNPQLEKGGTTTAIVS